MKRIVSSILAMLVLCTGAAWASGAPSGEPTPEVRIASAVEK